METELDDLRCKSTNPRSEFYIFCVAAAGNSLPPCRGANNRPRTQLRTRSRLIGDNGQRRRHKTTYLRRRREIAAPFETAIYYPRWLSIDEAKLIIDAFTTCCAITCKGVPSTLTMIVAFTVGVIDTIPAEPEVVV